MKRGSSAKFLERSFDHIGLVPVVLAHPLDKQELAIGGRFIRNAVGCTRQDPVSLTDSEHASMVGTARLDREGTLQHEIMIRTLAVIVPKNNVALRQREHTGLNLVADHDGLNPPYKSNGDADRGQVISRQPALKRLLLFRNLADVMRRPCNDLVFLKIQNDSGFFKDRLATPTLSRA
jgi:hypothetical protein